jgi:glycosyltransferase involved in cell wall biosynthesis
LGFGKKIILYCGRLHPEKHPEDVLRALPYVKKDFPESVLLFVGDGPQKDELRELADDLGVSDSVIFLGFQKADRVRDLLYTADVIVAPLMGSALVEAALSSTPIVAYDIEWHSELIKNEETGLLVRYRDFKGMASAILRIFKNYEEANFWGKNAREYAMSMFEIERILSFERKCFSKFLR